jgi:hypothetical protein
MYYEEVIKQIINIMEAGNANPALFLVIIPVLLLVSDELNSGKENEPNCTLLRAVPFGAFGEGPI